MKPGVPGSGVVYHVLFNLRNIPTATKRIPFISQRLAKRTALKSSATLLYAMDLPLNIKIDPPNKNQKIIGITCDPLLHFNKQTLARSRDVQSS